MAFWRWRLKIAAMRSPGTECTTWLTSPRPMKPAPILPMRSGFCCASLALSALSMMIIVGAPAGNPGLASRRTQAAGLRQGHPPSEPILPGVEQRRRPILVGDHADRQRPAQPEPRIVVAQRPLVGRTV